MDMIDSNDVTLDVAEQSDAPLLANLLELYIHDLSEAFPLVELGVDGRFGYNKLPLYWSEANRFPFLIRYSGRVVGFALATRGSPASDNPDVLDVAEFFVIRRYRRAGVARRAAFLLWDRLPGRWFVRASERNTDAIRFWARVVDGYTGGTAKEFTRSGIHNDWRVFSLESYGAVIETFGA